MDHKKYVPAIRGSIRGVSVISVPSAFAALERNTSLEVSARDLANVRWSCGRNGLRNVGIFSSRLFNVSRIAAAVCQSIVSPLSLRASVTFHIH